MIARVLLKIVKSGLRGVTFREVEPDHGALPRHWKALGLKALEQTGELMYVLKLAVAAMWRTD